MRLRRAVLQIPSKSSVPPRLPLYKSRPPLTLLESTLLQVLIPLDFISYRINTYKKPGGGCPSQDAKVSQLVTPPTWPHHAYGSARRVQASPAAIPVSPFSFLLKWEPSTLRVISEHSLATPMLLLSVGCQLSAFSSPASPFHATLASRPQAAEIKTTLSPAFATPTHSAAHKSFVCRSYKKHRGWGGTANPGCLSQFSHGPRITGSAPRVTNHGSWVTAHAPWSPSTVAPQPPKCQNHGCYCFAAARETSPRFPVSNRGERTSGSAMSQAVSRSQVDPRTQEGDCTRKKAWVQRSKVAF